MRVTALTLLAALIAPAPAPAREPTRQELLAAIEKQLKGTIEAAGPTVACVVVSRSDRYPKAPESDPPGKLGGYDPVRNKPGDPLDLADPKNIPDHGAAGGVVIDPAGLVLTPYHVVEGAKKVYVHVGRTGSYADVHAADARCDLAVLKLITPPPKLTAVKFADVRLGVRNGKPSVSAGSFVVLMAATYASGFALDRPTAALETVTAVRVPHTEAEDKSTNYYLYGPLLEFGPLLGNDARPPLGSDAKASAADGSALFNLDGEFLGLTTSSAAVTGERYPRYAFPADENFRRVVDVLRRGEEVEYGFLGVTLQNNKNPPVQVPPLQIMGITPHGPAALAGLHGGYDAESSDRITHVNHVPIATYEELLFRVGSALAGNKVTLTVARGRASRDVDVRLGKLQHGQPVIASARPDPVFGLRVEYGSILSQKLKGDARPLGPGVPDGVCVRTLAPDSPAEAAFKKLGDRPERWLITHLNGAPLNAPADFYKAAKGRPTIKLTMKDPAEPNSRDREVTFP